MTGELLIGIDMGTGSTKGVVTTADGRIVATASRKHGMELPRPGWAEVDAETVWWGDLVEVARELAGQIDVAAVTGMCVSGVGPCLLLTDDDLNPTRNGILYGIDMRATQQIEDLTERFGAEAIVERCGKALSTQAVGPKIAWVRENEPEVWERSTRWFNSNSYVVAKLTGEYVIDHHTASQSDPLYDVHARDWADDWAAEVADGLQMPRLAWPHEVVGELTAAAAEELGLAEGIPVSAGTVDAWAEAFSAGVRRPGDLMLMYGSTMFFVQVLEGFHAHPLLWTTNGVERDQYTLAAGMSTSGSLTTWVQQLTGDAPFEDLVAEASEVDPGADGLVVLPYFAGERTPIFDARARGVVAGLSLRHGRAHLFRAAYEGIACGIRQIVEFLDSEQDPIKRLVAVGGGTQGGLWTQIVSDVTGRPQDVPEQTIGASYGDALLAAIGTGLVPPETDWARVGSTVEPRPQNREVYDKIYRVYTELYPATKEQVHALSRLQEDAFGEAGQGDAPVPEVESGRR
ncbi:FGGY-family carbohydrate kinase [Agilicoccus flavus]|uniref:FGGY-family carbohydrate kinase n=1 Tax=Agilicoccus flavus TaxID=2775968 RepID=UPI001CF6BDA7|nr:FGGY-family carbohydrate kinase [Agilicoccus flavus]